MIKLGFIGFGEAAFNIAKGLKGEGLDGITAYDKFWKDAPGSELICKRASEAQVRLVPTHQESGRKERNGGFSRERRHGGFIGPGLQAVSEAKPDLC